MWIGELKSWYIRFRKGGAKVQQERAWTAQFVKTLELEFKHLGGLSNMRSSVFRLHSYMPAFTQPSYTSRLLMSLKSCHHQEWSFQKFVDIDLELGPFHWSQLSVIGHYLIAKKTQWQQRSQDFKNNPFIPRIASSTRSKRDADCVKGSDLPSRNRRFLEYNHTKNVSIRNLETFQFCRVQSISFNCSIEW